MYPIVTIFGRPIGTYALSSVAGILLAGWYACRAARRRGVDDNEIIVLLLVSAVGILLGIPLGIGLDRFLILSITAMPLEVVITARAIALSCGVTMLFALAVNVVIGRKMREIDMLGALKSVE